MSVLEKGRWRLLPLVLWVAFVSFELQGSSPAASPVTGDPFADSPTSVKSILRRSLQEHGAIRKSLGPVRLSLQGAWSEAERRHVAALVSEWRSATPSLELELVDGSESNLTVYSIPATDFGRYDSSASGDSHLRLWTTGGRIDRARILIDLAAPDRLALIERHLLNALGLTVLAEDSTEAIELALAQWYRPDLVPGLRLLPHHDAR